MWNDQKYCLPLKITFAFTILNGATGGDGITEIIPAFSCNKSLNAVTWYATDTTGDGRGKINFRTDLFGAAPEESWFFSGKP